MIVVALGVEQVARRERVEGAREQAAAATDRAGRPTAPGDRAGRAATRSSWPSNARKSAASRMCESDRWAISTFVKTRSLSFQAASGLRPTRRARARCRGYSRAAIGVRDVHVSRGAAGIVLRGLDLDIAAGETIALVGRSGAGKSTLLKLINGLIVPDRGQVVVEGRDTREWNPVRAPPPDRLRAPGDRPVSPHDGRGERRRGAETARVGRGAHRRARRARC